MNIIRGATVPLVATAPLAATAPLGPPEILAWGPTFFENLKTATAISHYIGFLRHLCDINAMPSLVIYIELRKSLAIIQRK